MLKKVYISSTYKDLIVYREAIRDMFLSKGLQGEYTLVGMEGYVSESGKRAIEVCLEDVREADIYILILAKRYGSIVEGTDISYTETEYNEAVKVASSNPQYKIFVFYSDEEIEKEDFTALVHLQNDGLKKFYNAVLSKSAGFINPFTSPDNLCKQILLSFSNIFKKPSNVNDYNDALKLVNRNIQSYSFSKSIKKNINSFYFSSSDKNSPVDFLDRLCDFEMAGKQEKLSTELSTLLTTSEEKFRDNFIAELKLQSYWDADKLEYSFTPEDKLFISIKITSMQITDGLKLGYLEKVLKQFLPAFLTENGATTSKSRIFFIFYSSNDTEPLDNGVFKDFIKSLTASTGIPNSFYDINSLTDITKTDTKKWLEAFIKNYKFDENTIEEILEIDDDESPPETFKMRQVNKNIKNWIDKEFFKNG